MKLGYQKLPTNGPERELLRERGQFWTPPWIAEAMVAYVLAGSGCVEVLDPAVGAGAFFHAAKKVGREMGREIDLAGCEIDPSALVQAKEGGLLDKDLAGVQLTDFVLRPPARRYHAIVANPPYIRHHRLSTDTKTELKQMSKQVIGEAIDGRAGLHIYFLIRALLLLTKGGRLSFIIPADTCEGVFSEVLWKWITKNYRLEAVITFTADASPFPGVDVNPVILMISNNEPVEDFFWAKCSERDTYELKDWVQSGPDLTSSSRFMAIRRELYEGLETGLTRAPSEAGSTMGVLSDFATVMRGIATGANDFFFLTRKGAQDIGIPDEFLKPAIGRTRDVTGDTVTIRTLQALEQNGRPTLLFSPDGRSLEYFPAAVRRYLEEGEAADLHRKSLISTRNPWYKMESRTPPHFLFSYLGRRRSRFIRNNAGVVPLTSFLCVYAREDNKDYVDRLWHILQDNRTVENLARVGKSYGSGAIKVEPRALERLPLPKSVVVEAGLAAN